jgi:iron-sulfur cluster repair protein YtfE (RIC family)
MTLAEARVRVLADHVAIRGMLSGVEDLARRVAGGERPLLSPLRAAGETLMKRLEEHIFWEDLHLVPLLRAAGGTAARLAARLDGEHREQREVLAHCLAAVQDARRPAPLVARTLVDLIALLRSDMEAEESELPAPLGET